DVRRFSLFMMRGGFGVALLLLLAVALPASVQAARQANIDEVIVTNSSREVLLYLTVRNAFTPEMEKGVQSGLPVTFTFYVELYRHRSGWLDQKVVARSFEHILSYDTLKDEYRVVYGEHNGKTVIVKTMAEASALMAQVNGFGLSPLAALMADAEYTLKVKARLAEKTLPLSIHAVIPFWSLWDFETDWYTIQFRY
ncbi:MAG TPA: DUF4390 domain-containing protein, partial [Desulfurivibrionaceae bacterium]|nr:DUF4390 domain-containing protein [Desulfurivibrionaceae bacterium]